MKCSHICKECGEQETKSWMEDVMKKLIENQLCFDCQFWIEKLEVKHDPRTARIDGIHYHIGDEEYTGRFKFRGFSGRKFVIKFHDGRELITTNLWTQSHIPERFKQRLPDNAVFIRDPAANNIIN